MSKNGSIRRVLLCGAQSTGKTTLLNDVISQLKIHNEAEVARAIMVERNWTNRDIDPKTKPYVFEELQLEVLRKQKEIDERHLANKTDYMSDRGLDALVYAKVNLSEEAINRVVNSELGQYCIGRVRNSLVFLLTPHPEIAKPDGIRLDPEMQVLNRFTEAMIENLEHYHIPYHKVQVLDRRMRVQQVLSVVQEKYPELVIPSENGVAK